LLLQRVFLLDVFYTGLSGDCGCRLALLAQG